MRNAKSEPAAITGIAAALLNAAVLIADLGLSSDEQGIIVGAITIIAGFYVRSRVRPVA